MNDSGFNDFSLSRELIEARWIESFNAHEWRCIFTVAWNDFV